MVACIWGVFVWKEFRGANARAKGYLAAMFAAYVLALVLIARAYAGVICARDCDEYHFPDVKRHNEHEICNRDG